jgi:hypothetical protein
MLPARGGSVRRRLQRIVGIGVLLLAAGCATGAGLAADLPQARPLPMLHPSDDALIPVRHPPDAIVTSREPDARWEKQLNLALLRAAPAPVVNWALLGLVVAF